MRLWHRWKRHEITKTPYLIEFEDTGHQQEAVRVECSCGKVWAE